MKLRSLTIKKKCRICIDSTLGLEEESLNRRECLIIALVTTFILTAVMREMVAKREVFPHVSAIATNGQIGIYWDKACTQRANSILWGTLQPSKSREVIVYARNEGNQTVFLTLLVDNWNPTEAAKYLKFSSDSVAYKMQPSGIARISNMLKVSSNIRGISVFSFDIFFNSTRIPPWDTNQDGYVNIFDLIVVNMALGSTPNTQNWDARADVNRDGIVNVLDAVIVSSHLGEKYV